MSLHPEHENEETTHNIHDKKDGVIRKQDYIEERASDISGIHKDTIKLAFNTMWDVICDELETGNTVKLHGKGRFYLSRRSSRVGRNPLTGEEYDVPEREAMAFQTSPAYAKRLRERRKELKDKQQGKVSETSDASESADEDRVRRAPELEMALESHVE